MLPSTVPGEVVIQLGQPIETEAPLPITVSSSSYGMDALTIGEEAAFQVHLHWFAPTEENPYWLVRVQTPEGQPFPAGIGSADTALADVLDQLLPPDQ